MKATKLRPDGLSSADHRSLSALERRAREILLQCGHLRANAKRTPGVDRERFSLIELYGKLLVREAERGYARLQRERGDTSNPKPRRRVAPGEPTIPYADRYPAANRDPKLAAYLPGGARFTGAAQQSLTERES